MFNSFDSSVIRMSKYSNNRRLTSKGICKIKFRLSNLIARRQNSVDKKCGSIEAPIFLKARMPAR